MQKLLIVGCGDIARRMLPRLRGHYHILALIRDAAQRSFWRSQGAHPVVADLDQPDSLRRIAGLANVVVHLAPPPTSGEDPAHLGQGDRRTRQLLAALARGRSLPQRIVYISTTGVYGDCAGRRIDETCAVQPISARARRRVDAERQLRAFGRRGVVVSILRAPGIYAAERLPLARLAEGKPVLRADDDVFTNHIHADDLAMLACAALRRGRSNRAYNATDDSEIRMGDYFDLLADRFGLPRPPRLSLSAAEQHLSAVQLSFMRESRRLSNERIKRELGIALRYPQVRDGLDAAWVERKQQCSS
ncbi:MAG TPA: SDR family oxidoreductase [Accumulibacter sp.]|uniref:SDR family oxidoreductase n=1 Tax=Accumulibacter sp. TaxID=2053492 RepID=UPI002878975B|nr:SDR family oxidoreductase [Accumulibacter sp.]MDS4055209.1 SDR family oxidoreductase [Accumulibacter sp.]HMV06160.1 SDR family oxidoreductase [Accumulibacter sp.]HMW62474.1 SDR family oxidoreductase [Accumulibacter sp.]HMW79022.1 SDR family oxidoreductase [Accumulibacter sp.]HMX67476.1 SDR family oxidoreductase [Accumulibacter sp.]